MEPFLRRPCADNCWHCLKTSCQSQSRLGVRPCAHPDEPPFSLLCLPRILSTEADYREVLDHLPDAANCMTLYSGALGARPDNDLPGIMRHLGDCVLFLHLRNVQL
jgi:mannonate dehydratase